MANGIAIVCHSRWPQ